jgi:WD40 repeat protein
VSPVHLEGKVDTVAVSPDARWLAWGGDDARVLLWRREDGKTLALDTGAKHVATILWDESGALLAGTGGPAGPGSRSGQVQVWNPERGERRGVIQAHAAAIHALDLRSIGNVVASASADTTIGLCDWREQRKIAPLLGHQTTAYAVAWSAGGELLVSGDGGGNLCVWDWESRRRLIQLTNPARAVFRLAFVDDHAFAAATDGGLLTRYDLRAFDRAIAGNARYWLDRIPTSEQDPQRAEQLRQWSQRVLAEAAD